MKKKKKKKKTVTTTMTKQQTSTNLITSKAQHTPWRQRTQANQNKNVKHHFWIWKKYMALILSSFWVSLVLSYQKVGNNNIKPGWRGLTAELTDQNSRKKKNKKDRKNIKKKKTMFLALWIQLPSQKVFNLF